nr:unnamed protein product [Spirometra erinaceieuropaei]
MVILIESDGRAYLSIPKVDVLSTQNYTDTFYASPKAPSMRIWAFYILTAVVPANSASGKASQHRSLDQEMREAVVKMRIKGGAVVDPDSGMEDIASVLKDSKGRPLSAILGMVDLVKGVNSYYRLQVLVSDKEPKRYWVFRAWGRTGTTIGGNKIESFANAHSATEHFEDLYREKTGNYWGTRKEDFEKIPFKFYPLEMDYGEESTKTKGEEIHHIPSKLEVRIQALMRFLFDEVSMQNALREFEIDIRKMPLGKLSKNQIQEAYGILGELSKLLSTKPPKSEAAIASRHTALISNSTQFFTLIPHDFGLKAPPILDSLDVIKTKSRMLEDLLEMEVAYSLMKTDDSHVNPLDDHYAKLHNRIEPLDHESKEFLRIVEYMQKTHASTHSAYTLEVVDIFSVEREGEAERYQAFKDLSNKMLLWHGSRRTNWAGILAQGLRIAPPEAPVTGYMFGKGIYFADMCSKSANYCFPSHETPQGCLLLCEVALGNMHECSTADDSKLKGEYNSRKGVGATCPDPDTYYTDENGVVYPTGQPKSTAVSGHLLYNEFIVYNTAQVRQKYLVWVNFKFK